MCGLNGIFAYNVAAGLPRHEELIGTRDYMILRGPDGAGEYWSPDRRLGLGHRRLSIIDLSDRAGQPMHSADGRYVVVFNGEIYNYPELKRELGRDGVIFATTSDTEVLLHLYARKGQAMVHHLRGMFAFVIWDNLARSIFLARDPYGIKPLYYADDGWTFRFASQVKALLAGGKISRDPEPAGIVGFHLWGSVPEPFTLYRAICALPAGHIMLVDEAGPRQPQAYASIATMLGQKLGRRAEADGLNAAVEQSVAQSVAAHLLADVEVGIFLSAGIDSGALLGLMRDAGQAKIRAITLSFDEFMGTSEDEAPIAAQVAQYYGAEHLIRHVGPDEFNADLPAMMDAMDQPSIDGVNSWFVSKAAREVGLKVAISGIGGDEILAGYPSFHDLPRWVSRLRWTAAFPGAGIAVRKLVRWVKLMPEMPKAAGMLEYGGSWAGAYLLRRALFLPYELRNVLDPELVDQGLERLNPLRPLGDFSDRAGPQPLACVAALESSIYMRNQLLRDADWAGMAHSIEIRTPLVDSQVAQDLAPFLPIMGGGEGKQALALAPKRAIPEVVAKRNKTGFGVPTGVWAQSSLKRTNSSKGKSSRIWGLDVYSHFVAAQRDAAANLARAARLNV